LSAHAIAIPEELSKAQTTFEDGGAVPEGTLDGLPLTHALAGEGQNARAGDPFAEGLAVAEIVAQAPIEEHDDDISFFVEIPFQIDVRFVEEIAPPGKFEGNPDQHGEHYVEEITNEALPELREGKSVKS